MSERKQIQISLSGDDLELFIDIQKHLEKNLIITSDAEILRICLRGFHRTYTKIKPEVFLTKESEQQEELD